MKKAFKVFYFRDKMTDKPTVKAFSDLVALKENSEVTKAQVSSLISAMEHETKETKKKLETYRAKLSK